MIHLPRLLNCICFLIRRLYGWCTTTAGFAPETVSLYSTAIVAPPQKKKKIYGCPTLLRVPKRGYWPKIEPHSLIRVSSRRPQNNKQLQVVSSQQAGHNSFILFAMDDTRSLQPSTLDFWLNTTRWLHPLEKEDMGLWYCYSVACRISTCETRVCLLRLEWS